MNKIDKFYDIKNLLQCPICGRKIRFHAGGLVCKKEHRFDISSKGYVNFLQASKPMKGYDRQFFECRRRVFEAGCYDHIVDGVTEAVVRSIKDRRAGTCCESRGGHPLIQPLTVVDAGCGEGFYGLAVERRLREIGADGQVLAFDIASDAVKVAARSDAPVKWMVADITNIPVKDGAADVVLDVFTPANYGEFARILAEDGVVIKVVPGANHMAQLRAAAAKQLRSEAYSNEDVLDYFLDRFDLLERFTVSRTVPVDQERLADLVNMTPVLFDVDKGLLDLSAVTEITVEGEIVAGRPRNGQDFS